jgi:hypothetical protein
METRAGNFSALHPLVIHTPHATRYVGLGLGEHAACTHVGVTMCWIASRVMHDSARRGSLLDRALMIDRSALAVVPDCSPNSRVGGSE